MNETLLNASLFHFLRSSPSPFHAAAALADQLHEAGFVRLREDEYWSLTPGASYYLVRENAGLVAFRLGTGCTAENGFRVLATHSDSPGLQIKPRADRVSGAYLQLGVEVYGGPLLNPWFDRDLSIAGRVCCRLADGNLQTLLIDFSRPLLVIPSLAVHFDRSANENRTINAQNHMAPIIAQAINKQLPKFQSILRDQLANHNPELQVEDILGFELFCYDIQQPVFTGLDNEFISAGRLDNLLSCHVAARALVDAGHSHNILLFCANHEENGSVSTSGARGAFLESVLERIVPEPQPRHIALARSFLVSIDNAHAVHPNFRDSSDPQHETLMNGGPVIKINANQRYATNCVSAALFKIFAREAETAVQEFVMRSDMPCGSTIGPLTSARLGVRTVDVGVATLSMHSIRELAGSRDPFLLYKVVRQFLISNTDIRTMV
jgi:aspartyl aminopeptidase